MAGIRELETQKKVKLILKEQYQSQVCMQIKILTARFRSINYHFFKTQKALLLLKIFLW